MASVFTYDPDPPRVSSPWSTSGSSTPQASTGRGLATRTRSNTNLDRGDPDSLADYGITKLEPEPQEGPTEYKLHLLLRPRRFYTSMSTGHVVGGSYHSRVSLSTSNPTASSYEGTTSKPPQTKSIESRQQRLQQLTTQLLWRLQQSSPFHSSATGNLVLPVLPETTQPGVPPKPARLLPGLEESQGALYEIGVADDGTFVGLTQDEIEESLATLQIMAASLGCKVEVLRRVVVGRCEWEDDSEAIKVHAEGLWVAEALVSPDLDFYNVSASAEEICCDAEKQVEEDDRSRTEQIRVSITGPSTAGKSSLLGTLTSSVLDNGRGTSRLSLLKHRHEISSGITSSVAQELIGYADTPSEAVDVINYASGNVAAWDDIHAASNGGRLAFVSDLPGSVRYLKSTLRGLVSWAPHYVMLCIPANCEDGSTLESGSPAEATDISLALSHLDLCIKLEVPIVVLITKMDLASRAGLRNNLTKVLSALKLAGKKPAMLPVGKSVDLQQIDETDTREVKKIIDGTDGDLSSTVPIVLTSAVDGSGIGKLHAFLRHLPVPERPPMRSISLPNTTPSQHLPANIFDIDEVFAIPPSKVYSMSSQQTPEENQGVVLCGLVRYGAISVGDELVIGPLLANTQTDHANTNTQLRSRSEQHSDTPMHDRALRSRSSSGEFSTSFTQGFLSGKASFPAQAQWQRVRVVSVRFLRLSVRKLTQDQVGTIGIEPVPSPQDDQPPRLGRLRKGTVLASFYPSPSIPKTLLFHTGFVATFPSSEFSSSASPPLLLGGNAIVYIANIRTTVKATCVTLAENEVISSPPSPTEPEFFSFDGDSPDKEKDKNLDQSGAEVNKVISSSDNPEQGDIKIAFSFVTSVEWVEVGSRVLLMPGMSLSSPAISGSVSPSGLEGFVGRVCDVLHEDSGLK
ncbi:hypothetical protein ASPWEDRAFT_164966 [Aspergillus wentii DTO 134E9]|uniref:Tr-type G domain-containing protein n=1 Tax=Aspergillus wentii DTO 134E9 TaxID=1073089 RepID=A0A1L9R6T1_ASPWE|nr:uncharacterized protein ASPWEDRAFT_164966 [Aspergillus wentii DTO 134E9]KAI9926718.1 hypothetical protein MW887_003812 [Aspergillus wentii]OJJ30619.1 hypothetical protein ASPWEDRAFT_164966 [Aspergillus wentii DTO 134E9]